MRDDYADMARYVDENDRNICEDCGASAMSGLTVCHACDVARHGEALGWDGGE